MPKLPHFEAGRLLHVSDYWGREEAGGMPDQQPRKNGDVDWDGFGAQEYFEHNYRSMRGDDEAMLTLVRTWFDEAVPRGRELAAVDVGAGANLYPALLLLRHSAQITLYEHSRKNVEWLTTAIADLSESWRPFADLTCPHEEFESVRTAVGKKCTVRQGSIFEIPQGGWDLGTMFFVAESLTNDADEFDRALDRFLGALRPGAPFAAAFMERSTGYDVGDVNYPAVSLDAEELTASFKRLKRVDGEVGVTRFDIDPAPIRLGYEGYLVATGKVKG
jgi:hypothetical protein